MATKATLAAKRYLTTKEAAIYLDLSESFLEKDRLSGAAGIPFTRIKRMVKYRPTDLDEWDRNQTKK